MKRIILIIFTVLLSLNLHAQEAEKPGINGRPNIKGDLFFDVGFNVLNNRPEDLNTGFFASKTANFYYQYPIHLGENSGITFNPGIGLGMDKLAFSRDSTLVTNPAIGAGSSQFVGVETLYGQNLTINTNKLALNYIDIPLEFRYHANKTNYDKGFRFALGGKVGVLYNAHTKVEVTDANGLTRKIKTSQDFGSSPVRYGIYARVGLPGFNLWSYYGLNKVFENGKGPFGTEATQFNFGLSVALF
ncbi:MAG TPA: porin family protein [Cyclobacteriaceae bacterium]|nr:porin family protein [Cyclobacteriaceae bacterium]